MNAPTVPGQPTVVRLEAAVADLVAGVVGRQAAAVAEFPPQANPVEVTAEQGWEPPGFCQRS